MWIMEWRGVLAIHISMMIFGGALAFAASVHNPVSLDQDFTLRMNQSANIQAAGLTVTFRSVLEDSRCPTDVVCIWQGNARVVLDIADEKGEISSIKLTRGAEPRIALAKRYKLRFVSLAPESYEGVSIPASDYTITLRLVGKRGD